jgi:uncharacterized protein
MLVRMGRALAILLFVAGPALAADRYPAYTGYVVDTAGVLDAQSVQRIRDTASRLDRAGIAQISVLTVRDLGDQSPEDYAVGVFQKWGLGHKAGKKDDGVLVLMVPGPPGKRRTKVETGYDIEGVLPDGKLGAIYDRAARPYILQNDYGGAASSLVDAIAGELDQDAAAGGASRPIAGLQRSRRPAGNGIPGVAGLALAVVCMVVLLVALASTGARRRFPGPRTGLLAAALIVATVAGLLLLGGAIGWIALLAGLVANGFAYASIRSHRCPRDGSWMVIDEEVVDRPTYWSTGLARVVEACSNPRCGYRREYQKELPRKQRTVYIGGGGGGFGGGGFGGGGGGDGFSGGGGGGSGGGGISRSD